MSGGKLLSVLEMRRDGRVADLFEEVGPPVPLQAGRVEAIEQALHCGERHRPHVIQRGFADAAHGFGGLIRLLGRRGRAPDDPAHLLVMQVRREQGHGRHGQEGEEAAHVLRRLGDEFAVRFHDLGGLVEWPEGRARAHHLHWVQAEEERCDDPEVAAASAHRPVQIRVFLCISCDEAPVGEHHVHRQKIIDGQTVGAAQMADPTAQRQPRDASRRNRSRRRGHPKGVRGVIHVGAGATTLGPARCAPPGQPARPASTTGQ